MDYEFEKVRDHVPSININTTAASEHIREIERKIHVITERAQGIHYLYPTLQATTLTTGHPPSSLCCHVIEQLSCG